MFRLVLLAALFVDCDGKLFKGVQKCCKPCPCKKPLAFPPKIDDEGCLMCACPRPRPVEPGPECTPCQCQNPVAPPSVDEDGCLRCSCPNEGPAPPGPPGSPAGEEPHPPPPPPPSPPPAPKPRRSAQDAPPPESGKRSTRDAPPPPAHRSERNVPPPPAQRLTRDAPPPPATRLGREVPPIRRKRLTKETPQPAEKRSTRDAPPPAARRSARDAPPPPVQRSARDALPPPHRYGRNAASPSAAQPSGAQGSLREAPPPTARRSALLPPPPPLVRRSSREFSPPPPPPPVRRSAVVNIPTSAPIVTKLEQNEEIPKVCCAPCPCVRPLKAPTRLDDNGCIICLCPPPRPRQHVDDENTGCPDCPCEAERDSPMGADGCPACNCPEEKPIIQLGPPSRQRPFNQIKATCARTCQPNCNDYVRNIDTLMTPCNKMCAHCKCEEGLLLENGRCVDPAECGCYGGKTEKYYKIGDEFEFDDEICECVEQRNILCTEKKREGSGDSIDN